MRNFVAILISFLLLITASVKAQNNEGKADDGQRISLTPIVSDQQIPEGAKNLLLNKMKQICAKNGMAGDGMNPFFVMDATVDILSKELTPTAPPMHALNMQVNFYIKDVVNNNVYSETSIEIKGVGKNETKAYIAGLKNINTSKGQFKAFVERGKTKILEFYNSECDFILAKAKALKEQGNNGEAIKVLKSVPKVSLECYDKCMEILGTIEPPAEPELVAESTGDTGASDMDMMGGDEQEIEDNIYLVYMGGKQMGDKTLLHFEFQNRGQDDFELNDYAYDTRAVDGNGNEFKVESVKTAGKEGSYSRATVMVGTPVPMECQFAKLKSVAMFEFKYKGKTFRLKDITVGGAATVAAEPKAETTATVSTGLQNVGTVSINIGAKVLAEISGNTEFKYHTYTPSKVLKLASAATKGEYEVMSMGSGSSENKWTDKVVAKWHIAKKEELKEGLVVLYSKYDIEETSELNVGVVVAIDELYKNLATIKGRYNDIYKVEIGRVVIPDFPKVKAP